MIGFKLQAIGKDNFFNSAAVMKALSDADRRVLSKFGAYVRTRARTSIRPALVVNRKELKAGKGQDQTRNTGAIYKPSQPGEPPRSRQGDLKKFILFGYDPTRKSVVIGAGLGGSRTRVQERMEHGGEVTITKPRSVWLANPTKKVHLKAGKVIRVKKRPFMKPAFDTELQKMPALWADSMKRG